VDRAQKEQKVAELNETFGAVNLLVVTQNNGLTVAEATDLRRQIRSAGAGFKVTKNRLTRLALMGTKFEALQTLFTGPTAIAYSDDPVAAAKVCVEFAKKSVGRRRRHGTRQAAVTRRTARQVDRHSAGPGHQGGNGVAGSRRPAGPRL
jgi:ribosomal protein L10